MPSAGFWTDSFTLPVFSVSMTARISVIIPAFNEQRQIADVIRQTRAAGECEIIVVDGASTDATRERASEADQILSAPRGRASQQNAGARAATGEILLFLHADCRLPDRFDDAVRSALEDRRVAAGCFRQRIDHPGWQYRVIERGNARRAKVCGWIYGDQGLFVRRDLFLSLGGFPDLPLMEDLYFSKMLRREGKRVVLEQELRVSPRRWERHGVVRQTLKNWSYVTLAHLGVPMETIARWYSHVRDSESPPNDRG
jgi:rSAM/selenodomain-associated transferase 2